MFKKEYKSIRKNYIKYISLLMGIQALALLVAFSRISVFIDKGIPLDRISLLDMSIHEPFMIAFLFSVITCGLILIFGYKSLLSVISHPSSIQKKYIFIATMIISVVMVLFYIPYLIPV